MKEAKYAETSNKFEAENKNKYWNSRLVRQANDYWNSRRGYILSFAVFL